MKRVVLLILLIFLVSFARAYAVDVSIPGQVGQGEPFWVEVVTEAEPRVVSVHWMDRMVEYPVHLPGKQRILLGAGLDHLGIYPLKLVFDFPEGLVNKNLQIRIVEKEYPVQHLTLPEAMVTPPREVLDRITRERESIVAALNTLTPDKYWSGDFVRPVPGSVSSPFGVRRFMNDEPRAPHRGVDLRGAEGTPVQAVDAGRVILTGDFYYGGQTVIIDHGLGVHTVYMHLSKIQVNMGDMVARGDQVGLVGMTGRATGPHLHLGVYILGQAVDPVPLVGQ